MSQHWKSFSKQCFEMFTGEPPGGGGTPILDLTGCAAQQGVLLRQKLCDRVSFLIKIMRQGITIDKKIMRQGITWKDTF